VLPLMRTNDIVRLVCTTDPSVRAEDSAIGWVLADSASFDSDAMVVSIRPLRSSEVLRIGAREDSHVGLEAARLCTVSIAGPGVEASTPDQITVVLDRIRPAELTALGGKILELSLLPEDPTEGRGSEP
jgi:hypothetical protein